ncbi:MAG: lysophospholipid acyltransferase family protein [Melioribacteraceae bacterium]|nr:lysophospholipid acyltransferase family protein [Melioribacteraceae bacterium]
MKNLIEYILFRAIGFIIRIIGLKGTRAFAKMLALFLFYVVPIRKSVVINNLKIAFPEKTESEINLIVKLNYISFATTFAELLFIPSLSKEKILSIIFVENPELLTSTIQNSQRTILMTAHFGNWEIGSLAISTILNKDLTVMVKPQRNGYVNNYVNKLREKFGNTTIPTGLSIKEIYKTLLKGGIIAAVADQRGHPDGLRVNFFNRSTAIFTGLFTMAIKSNALILFALLIREPSGNYRMVHHVIDYDTSNNTLDENVALASKKYFDYLESYIKQNPEQWFWMHKIWKY